MKLNRIYKQKFITLKEVTMIKNTMKLGALAFVSFLAMALFLPSTVQAAIPNTSIDKKTVNITASIAPVNTLTTELKNISDNSAATGIAYGSISNPQSWGNLAQQYIKVTVDDNAASWRLRVLTDNFPTSTIDQDFKNLWGYAYGGMVGPLTSGAKTPMGWRNSATLSAPNTGDPGANPTVGWTFIKDIKDVDDPATTKKDDPATPKNEEENESFTFADTAGYTNVAYGGAGYTRIAKPEQPDDPNTPVNDAGSIPLATRSTPWFFYLEADFSNSPAASYSSSLVLELLNQ